MSKRLKRYRTSNTRRLHNKQFINNEKQFYESLSTGSTNNNEQQATGQAVLPDADRTREFWEKIWGDSVQHKKTTWLYDEKKETTNIKKMLEWKISVQEVELAVKKTLNWKGPGMDQIHNFWYKQFKSTHKQLAWNFTYLIEHPEETPAFMVKGITYLIPKTPQPTADPARYRPITCLPTIYKLLTSIISEKLYKHLELNHLLDEEQKGCRKGSRGCKSREYWTVEGPPSAGLIFSLRKGVAVS